MMCTLPNISFDIIGGLDSLVHGSILVLMFGQGLESNATSSSEQADRQADAVEPYGSPKAVAKAELVNQSWSFQESFLGG